MKRKKRVQFYNLNFNEYSEDRPNTGKKIIQQLGLIEWNSSNKSYYLIGIMQQLQI